MHHRDLEAWKESLSFVTEIYELTKTFPKEELWGLTMQIRRSAVSIPSNIAEGCGRNTPKETSRFMDIALGSIAEVETQLIIAKNLNYADTENLLNRVKKLNALVQGIKKYLSKVES